MVSLPKLSCIWLILAHCCLESLQYLMRAALNPQGKVLIMKRFISFSLAIVITLCMVVGSERRAWGYVDPGSGLIALQTIASVAAAYVYMVRRKIGGFFKRRKQDSTVVVPVTSKTGETREIA
jgi:hypothetical protein